eukprot:COSAG01_NODE_1639_length_9653_cov_33.252564_7_plen_229_part_00
MARVTAASHQYSIANCSHGCECKISSFSEGQWNAWNCDICGEKNGRGRGKYDLRWTCEEHDEDYCFECKPADASHLTWVPESHPTGPGTDKPATGLNRDPFPGNAYERGQQAAPPNLFAGAYMDVMADTSKTVFCTGPIWNNDEAAMKANAVIYEFARGSGWVFTGQWTSREGNSFAEFMRSRGEDGGFEFPGRVVQGEQVRIVCISALATAVASAAGWLFYTRSQRP